MSKKHKKICATLSYIEHLPILPSVVSGSISDFLFGWLAFLK